MPASMASLVLCAAAIATPFAHPVRSAVTSHEFTGLQHAPVTKHDRLATLAQCDLAEARVRFAQAEGKRETAISDLRSVVRFHRSAVKYTRDNLHRYCDPTERLELANAEFARVSAWLAELEDNTEALVVALKKLVTYQQKFITRVERLETMNAVRPDDTQYARDTLVDLERRLECAERKLQLD